MQWIFFGKSLRNRLEILPCRNYKSTRRASLFSDSVHRLPRTWKLTLGCTRNVGVSLFAHQENRKISVFGVPVVKLEGQASNISQHLSEAQRSWPQFQCKLWEARWRVPDIGDRFSPFAGEGFESPLKYLFCCLSGAGRPADSQDKKMGESRNEPKRPVRHSYRSDSVGCSRAARFAGR